MIERLKKNRVWVIYSLALLITGAILNYFTWSDDEEITGSFMLLLSLAVILLYLPFLVLTYRAGWKFREFGFVINPGTILISLLFVAFSLFTAIASTGTNFLKSLVEAIARTGEELFFRGFIFALVVRVLANQKMVYAKIWAVILSSLAFAVVHTQTFLPANNDTLFSIFLISLFLGSIRSLTGSILPGLILHLLFNTNSIVSVLLGCAIYGVFIFWAYRKGEDVFD